METSFNVAIDLDICEFSEYVNNNLDIIVIGRTLDIMECMENFNPMTKVNNYAELFEMKVVSFGFYDNELCVRVK